jgi:hypothetical protein
MFGASHLPAFEMLPAPRTKARRLANALLFLLPLLFGVIAVALGQDANWDLRNYHWYNAYAFLHGRYGFDLLPSQAPFFYNPTIDVPFYLLAQFLPAPVVGFILGAIQGLNATLLFLLAYAVVLVPSPMRRVLAAAALALLGMLGGGGIAMLGTTFYDNIVSVGILASILLVVAQHEKLLTAPIKPALLLAFICGLPVGLALGLKLTLIVFCVALCVAWFAFSASLLRRLLLASAFGLGITLGMLITQGHWMLFLWQQFDSPLFPYFNNIFNSAFAPPVDARDIKFIPQGLWDQLLFPFRFAANPLLVGEILWRDWRIPLLYGLLPFCALAAVVAGRRSDTAQLIAPVQPTRYLLWLAAAGYIIWLLLFSIYRYLVPLEMLAPLLIVLAIGLLPLTPKTKSFIAIALLLVVALSVQPGNWGRKAGDWSERYISATVPAIDRPDNTMLLMAGFEPYSHLVPFFPPAMPAIRIQSNFASPDQPEKGINRVIRDRIAAHRAAGGAFMLLIPRWQVDWSNEALAHFGLRVAPPSCREVSENLYEPPLLCGVEKF